MVSDEADSWDNDKSKRSISIRLDGADVDRVQAIARRLRVRASEVYRYAVKTALAKLAPLQDPKVAGSMLMPMLLDCGSEITQHFNLDARRLDHIINHDLDNEALRVAREDIELMAMAAMPDRYLYVRLRELAKRPIDPESVSSFLHDYLNQKYVARDDAPGVAPAA